MLKIPEDDKLIDAGQLYRYADGEYQRLKLKSEDYSAISFAECVRDTIGEMAYDLPEITPRAGMEWIFAGKDRSACSNCGFIRNIETQVGWHFCPNCGAHNREGGYVIGEQV